MTEVRVGSRGDSLVLRTDDYTDSVTVALDSGCLSAATRPQGDYDLRGLADNFAALADNSTAGWDPSMQWESLEGDIRLDARHSFGRVTIRAQLRDERVEPGNDGWVAHLDITLDPGEELRQAASDLWNMLGSPRMPQ